MACWLDTNVLTVSGLWYHMASWVDTDVLALGLTSYGLLGEYKCIGFVWVVTYDLLGEYRCIGFGL